MIRPSSAALALFTALLAGCSSASATDASATDALQSCLSKCAADPVQAARSVCGGDKVTYTGCDWECSNVPSGVGVLPGACDANGSPPVDGPPRPADGVTTCGWQKIDGAWIASPCAAALTPPARDVPAPVAKHPETKDVPLPAEVDHRARFGLVKNQGKAPSCTAFATTAALESAIRASVGEETVLSEMHLWSRYAEAFSEASTAAVLTGGTATNAAAVAAGMPYDEDLALAWSERDAYPDQRIVDKLNAAGRFKVTGVDVLANELGTGGMVERIQRALATGDDVNVGLMQSSEWSLPNDDGTIPEEEFGQRTGHAVLFVGYKTINGRPYFLLRNSWGRHWGLQGYAYLSFDAAKKKIMWATVTHIARRDLAEPKACAATHGPDLDNVCRLRCPDGSLAGADGLCDRPLPTCAAGQLHDASGVCVAACGTSTKSGPGWSVACDDATCKFIVDAGFTGCADDGKGTPCTKVCPAPQCDLGVMKDELGRTRLACLGHDL